VRVTIRRSALVVALIGVILGAFGIGRRLGAHGRQALPGPRRILSADADANADYGVGGLAVNGQETHVPPSDIFEQVLDNVQKQYVRSYGGERRLSDGALAQMLASLDDPKTDFLPAEMGKARIEAIQGRFYGIGAVLTVTQTKNEDVTIRHLTVVSVWPGGPAERAGLKSGDQITQIDAHWVIAYNVGADLAREHRELHGEDPASAVSGGSNPGRLKAGYSLQKALELLVEGEGRTHELSVIRPGEALPRKVTVTTALTSADPAEFRMLRDGIGYLRIRQFNDRSRHVCSDELQSASGLKGLVVDLRQCSGGVTAAATTGIDGYTPARELIAMLTAGGEVAVVERRPGQRQPLRIAASPGRLHIPLAVLIDAGTANLGELVAAALHDAGQAKLIGTRSFGDDVLQMVAPLKSGGAFEIASAHLYTLAGADLADGLRPDIDLGPEGVAGDGAVERARTITCAGSL
jgi:carboxyl-terminal processing protease